ncbi:MAG TPA: hypothetical protein VHP55_09805, partial [Usitatibacter sp.]|jgi:hypothetical protein|nr:hypothetical protein [Usitatibacter sp.]
MAPPLAAVLPLSVVPLMVLVSFDAVTVLGEVLAVVVEETPVLDEAGIELVVLLAVVLLLAL